jgi:hypothetical protein
MKDGDVALVRSGGKEYIVQYFDYSGFSTLAPARHHLIVIGQPAGKSWSASSKDQLPDFVVEVLLPGDRIEIT